MLNYMLKDDNLTPAKYKKISDYIDRTKNIYLKKNKN